MPKLILFRGLPGSGKSTAAKAAVKAGEIDVCYEADDFFVKDGEYIFDPKKLKDAHAWCQRVTEEALKAGKNVGVANTLLQRWELDQYLIFADDIHDVTVEVRNLTGDYGSVHNVPAEILKQMAARMEDIPDGPYSAEVLKYDEHIIYRERYNKIQTEGIDALDYVEHFCSADSILEHTGTDIGDKPVYEYLLEQNDCADRFDNGCVQLTEEEAERYMSDMRLPDAFELECYYDNFKECVGEMSAGLSVDNIRNLKYPDRHYYTDISDSLAYYVFNYMESIGDICVTLVKYNTSDGAIVFVTGYHHDAPVGETYKFELIKEEFVKND